MSKTAVIYSGAMRSFARTLPNHAWMLHRHLGEVDFFVSTYQDEDAHTADLLRLRYPNSRVEIEVVPEQPDCVAEMRGKGVELPAKWVPGQPYTHEPFAISVNPQSVLRQLWQLQKGWELMERLGNKQNVTMGPVSAGQLVTADKIIQVPDYDVIVRCRPDLWFQSFTKPEIQRAEQCEFGIYTFEPKSDRAFLPWWGAFGGCNDRFAILGATAAEGYFHAYEKAARLMKAGCPLHPETLVFQAMEGIDVRSTMLTEFATLRKDGTMRHPEISAVDIAHLAASR